MQSFSKLEWDSKPFCMDRHLFIDFTNENTHSISLFSSLLENKSYACMSCCVLEHIITNSDLSIHEKLYYILADSLSLIRTNSVGSLGQRNAALSANIWADCLGCSKAKVFAMQKSLQKKGYFIINKIKDKIGKNKRNLIIPTLPESVFTLLSQNYPDRVGSHLPYNHKKESRRSYLDRTKLFIKLNYKLIWLITSNDYLIPFQKMIWLDSYTKCYKSHMFSKKDNINENIGNNRNISNSFSFVTSYSQLAERYSCDRRYLSRNIKILEGLGFLTRDHFYTRPKHYGNANLNNNDHHVDNHNSDNDSNSDYSGNYSYDQGRRDCSLWKINLTLPHEFTLELEKLKDRSNLILLHDDTDTQFSFGYDNLDKDNVITNHHDSDISSEYIDSVMDKLDSFSCSSPTDTFESLCEKTIKVVSTSRDPYCVKSSLLLNKDLKINNKDLKSNLDERSNVLFSEFFRNFLEIENEKKALENLSNNQEKKVRNEKDFNICSALIREKLKKLPKDKADKARKFAYSLVSKKLAKGYAASLGKHELAKQLIYHIATWKPTKLGAISRDCEIDAALAIAWKKIVAGTWKAPLALAKAEILQHEFMYYKEKYQRSWILSHDVKSLETEVNNMLEGGFTNLTDEITKSNNIADNSDSVNLALEPALAISNNYCTINDNYEHRDYINNKRLLESSELDLEKSNPYKFELFNSSGEQMHITVDADNDNNIYTFDNINQQRFFSELKDIQFNEDGDFVMTLTPIRGLSGVDKLITDNNKESNIDVCSSFMAKFIVAD